MKKLYVGNLSQEINEEDLQSAFVSFGEVMSVSIIRDRQSGKSWGYGFVVMNSDIAASAAITGLDGSQLQGQTLKVQEGRRASGRQSSWRPSRPQFAGDRPRRW